MTVYKVVNPQARTSMLTVLSRWLGSHWRLLLLYGTPAVAVLLMPWLWTDSGASVQWEFFAVPNGFFRHLLPPTALLAVALLIVVLLLRKLPLDEVGEPLFAARWNFWFWTLVLVLFMARGLQYSDIFPVHHYGEPNSAILGAQFVGSGQPFTAYNTGFGLLFYPLYNAFGYSFFLSRTLTTFVWGVSLLAVLILFSRLHGKANSPLIFIPPVFVAMILPSLRTYTWHAGAMIASVAVFFLVAAAVEQSLRTRVVLTVVGVAFYAAALSAYHAVAFYLLVLAVIVGISYAYARPRRGAVLLSLAVLLLLGAASWLAIRREDAYPLAARLHFELSYGLAEVRPDWNWRENFLRSWDNIFYSFFAHDASFPIRVLFLLGLGGCVSFFRRSVFARTALVLFIGLFVPQMFLWGHGDWSQNCDTIVPVIGILLVALRIVERGLARLVPKVPAVAAALALCAVFSWCEYQQYFSAGLFCDRQYGQDPYDTKTQLTLALRDARRTIDAPDDTVVLMPALGGPMQPVAFDIRGLEYKHPEILEPLAGDDVRYFTSISDLAAQVRELQEQKRVPVRIYFGKPDSTSDAAVRSYVQALPPNSILVESEPYRETLGSYLRLFVTYVDVPVPAAGGTPHKRELASAERDGA
jgi:hypothetical protein